MVVVLPERAGDGARTEATAVGVRGAAADITGAATAVGVMAHGGGGAIIIERVSSRPNCPHCNRPLMKIDHDLNERLFALGAGVGHVAATAPQLSFAALINFAFNRNVDSSAR